MLADGKVQCETAPPGKKGKVIVSSYEMRGEEMVVTVRVESPEREVLITMVRIFTRKEA